MNSNTFRQRSTEITTPYFCHLLLVVIPIEPLRSAFLDYETLLYVIILSTTAEKQNIKANESLQLLSIVPLLNIPVTKMISGAGITCIHIYLSTSRLVEFENTYRLFLSSHPKPC